MNRILVPTPGMSEVGVVMLIISAFVAMEFIEPVGDDVRSLKLSKDYSETRHLVSYIEAAAQNPSYI
jgi:hypothetical protein